MKIALAIALLIASLGGCAIVPLDYGYRGDGYYRGDRYYRGDYRGEYRGDGYYYYRGDRYYRSYGYNNYAYKDHGQ